MWRLRSQGLKALSEKGPSLSLHHDDKKTVTRARRVIVAIGRSGNHRKLNIPGENLDKVFNRLYDPKDFHGKQALVVGGGDSALETAIALTMSGADVTLSYRKKEFLASQAGKYRKSIDAAKRSSSKCFNRKTIIRARYNIDYFRNAEKK